MADQGVDTDQVTVWTTVAPLGSLSGFLSCVSSPAYRCCQPHIKAGGMRYGKSKRGRGVAQLSNCQACGELLRCKVALASSYLFVNINSWAAAILYADLLYLPASVKR